MSDEAVIEQIKKAGPRAILIFGSAATGKRGQDSDLDILVISDTNEPFSQRSRKMRSMIKTHTPLDIIVLTPTEARELPRKSTFFSQIMREGKLVYGRI